MVKPVKFTRDSGCPARDEFLVINVVHILAVIPATSCSEALPGGCPRSLVGILKCLVSAFCQGYTTLSEI